MDTPEFYDKTNSFLALQDELRSGVPSDTERRVAQRDEALAELSTYFENPDRLERVFDWSAMRYEQAFLQRNKEFPWVDESLRLMLKEYREARDSDANHCFVRWGSMMDSVNQGMRNVSEVALLRLDIANHGPELTAKSLLRDVGDLLEGSLQSLVRLRLAMQEVSGMRIDQPPSIGGMTFGEVVGELASRDTGSDVYRPSPFGISVSQWRNIAHHNSYTVEGNRVTCTYGSPGRETQFSCTVSDLIELVRYVNTLGFLHKVAFEIFSIDNLDELKPYAPQLALTEYTRDAALVYHLNEAGFTIVNAACREAEWHLLLVDDRRRNQGEIEVAIHDAVIPYCELKGNTKFAALVKAGTSDFRFSFRVSMTAKPQIE